MARHKRERELQAAITADQNGITAAQQESDRLRAAQANGELCSVPTTDARSSSAEVCAAARLQHSAFEAEHAQLGAQLAACQQSADAQSLAVHAAGAQLHAVREDAALARSEIAICIATVRADLHLGRMLYSLVDARSAASRAQRGIQQAQDEAARLAERARGANQQALSWQKAGKADEALAAMVPAVQLNGDSAAAQTRAQRLASDAERHRAAAAAAQLAIASCKEEAQVLQRQQQLANRLRSATEQLREWRQCNAHAKQAAKPDAEHDSARSSGPIVKSLLALKMQLRAAVELADTVRESLREVFDRQAELLDAQLEAENASAALAAAGQALEACSQYHQQHHGREGPVSGERTADASAEASAALLAAQSRHAVQAQRHADAEAAVLTAASTAAAAERRHREATRADAAASQRVAAAESWVWWAQRLQTVTAGCSYSSAHSEDTVAHGVATAVPHEIPACTGQPAELNSRDASIVFRDETAATAVMLGPHDCTEPHIVAETQSGCNSAQDVYDTLCQVDAAAQALADCREQVSSFFVAALHAVSA